jgi:hypothetical protein
MANRKYKTDSRIDCDPPAAPRVLISVLAAADTAQHPACVRRRHSTSIFKPSNHRN